MSKVLVSDPIDQAGIDILSQVAQVDVKTTLSPEQLVGIIPDYDAMMIRSGTRVTFLTNQEFRQSVECLILPSIQAL